MPKDKARALTINAAQTHVKDFARRQGWKDEPNVDKIEHLHEELSEIARFLLYKSLPERKKACTEHREDIEDGIGDLFFGLCRLSNQLGVDITQAFTVAAERIEAKYRGKKHERKPQKPTGSQR